ncbi:coproporphyrinogen dehydrogenase [Flavobacteriaceae bacterium UJ101]|nr:coproporphyrinogen dehydrogenase [Flavobacteriaceae bacterium UJ101]
MVLAINEELILRKNYLSEEIETIYLGGGTPSILSNDEIEIIFETIYKNYKVSNNVEVTLEANPDDLTQEKIQFFQNTPINRFSIGIQSFFDSDLQFMNRAHNAKEAIQSIENVKKVGFDNITIDLIYGVPNSKNWKQNLEIFFDLDIPHLSSYALTVEDKTALSYLIKTKKVQPVDDVQQEREYNQLIEAVNTYHFEQYEISNFAKDEKYSKHNANYWKSKPYLGIGPSAHSFNGRSRQWNVANNTRYIKELQNHTLPSEVETLTLKDQFNEKVMIGLRTKWGIDLAQIRDLGVQFEEKLLILSKSYIAENKLIEKNGFLILNPEYRFFADGIASDLFMIE